MEKHPLHIKNPELQTSPEVERAVERKERRTGEKVPNDPAKRIEAYMDRLENLFLNPDQEKRERNLEMFRDKIHDALIIKKENFPESYFELQQRIARERGQAVEEIPKNVRERMMDIVIEDQKHSLDAIIDYLSSNDATYPAWFKYYAWTQLIKLSQFDKERGEFKKRTDSTVAPFPALHYGPLAAIADLYERVRNDNKDSEARREFDKRFPTLYAELIAKSLAEKVENREEIRGEWIKYNQGDTAAAETLFRSLKGKGTGWCTADGRTTAQTQIESGDFYVYYTNNTNGEPTQPRLAIRINRDKSIGEVRGILPSQGVEPVMQGVLDKKFQDFGSEADAYRKKSSDMKILTALEKKQEKGEPFTKSDLAFLYEVDSAIEGFGYGGKDPRVAELRKTRNPEMDMLTIFEYEPGQIARNPKEINENTKAYLGKLEPGIFDKIQKYNLEHIYTSFPEDKIRKIDLTIGGQSKQAFLDELKEKEDSKAIKISEYGKSMLGNKDFKVSKTPENLKLVRLKVRDLGFIGAATTEQVYRRAQELGLELCPPEVGPRLRLQYTNQPLNEWFLIGMKQIAGSGGRPNVFGLDRSAGGLWLDGRWAKPQHGWGPGREFVFRLRKLES